MTQNDPPRVSSFSQGAWENAWLTPFYSVYSKVPDKALVLTADKKWFTYSTREGMVYIHQKKKSEREGHFL